MAKQGLVDTARILQHFRVPMIPLIFKLRFLNSLSFALVFGLSTLLFSMKNGYADQLYFSMMRIEDPLGKVTAELIVQLDSSNPNPSALIWIEGDQRWEIQLGSSAPLHLEKISPERLAKIVKAMSEPGMVEGIRPELFQNRVEPTFLFSDPLVGASKNLGTSRALLDRFFKKIRQNRQQISFPAFRDQNKNTSSFRLFWSAYIGGWLLVAESVLLKSLQYSVAHPSHGVDPAHIFEGVWLAIFTAATFVWGLKINYSYFPHLNFSDFFEFSKTLLKRRNAENVQKALLLNQMSISGRLPFVPERPNEKVLLQESLTVRIETLPATAELIEVFAGLRLKISEQVGCSSFVLQNSESP